MRSGFQKKLEALLNSESLENGSNTPDFVLAQYLMSCLAAYNQAVNEREAWYGRNVLRMCCGALPVLKHEDTVYPGAVRYECETCHKTTAPCYSALGASLVMAVQAWNKGLSLESERHA